MSAEHPALLNTHFPVILSLGGTLLLILWWAVSRMAWKLPWDPPILPQPHWPPGSGEGVEQSPPHRPLGRPLVMPARLDIRPHTAVAWRLPARGWGLPSQARSSRPALPLEPPRLHPFPVLWPLCPRSQGRVLPWRSEARPQTKQNGFPGASDSCPTWGGRRGGFSRSAFS